MYQFLFHQKQRYLSAFGNAVGGLDSSAQTLVSQVDVPAQSTMTDSQAITWYRSFVSSLMDAISSTRDADLQSRSQVNSGVAFIIALVLCVISIVLFTFFTVCDLTALFPIKRLSTRRRHFAVNLTGLGIALREDTKERYQVIA